MNKNSAYKDLEKDGHKNIVLIEKKPNYFLDNHVHNFNVDIIIISGSLEIGLSKSSVVLYPGSRFKLKKNEVHTERAGPDGVNFLSARPE